MEKEQPESTVAFHPSDHIADYLPLIDRPELYPGLCEAVSENDESLREILCGGQVVGLAIVVNDGEEGYLYVYIFPEYRNAGYGSAAVKLAERQIMSPELSRIYTSYSVADEAGRRFAAKCGFPEKYASARMTYRGERFDLPPLPVRQYEDGDYAEAFALSAGAFHQMRLETGCFPDSVPAEPSEESRKHWAETADERYVYEAEGGLVGCAHLDGSELDSVSVRISAQGKGYGKNFVRFLVNRILEKEAEAPVLWCVAGNGKARRLYDSLGFEEDFCEAYAVKTGFSGR